MSPELVRLGLTLMLAGVLAGCDSSQPSSPTVPSPSPSASPVPQPPPQPTGVQVAGSVSDGAWRKIVGARVEVMNGPHAGLSAGTDSNGEFRLSGAFDESTEFRAIKDGYLATVRSMPNKCEPCNPDWWIHFVLDTVAPKADLAGNYSLTFVADCQLPDPVRTRVYDATLAPITYPGTPANTQFSVRVAGGSFHAGYDQFMVGVGGDYFSGFVGDLHGEPGIVEQTAPTTYLAFEGIPGASIATSDVSTIDASFDGVIDYCERKSAMGASFSCASIDAVARVRCVSKNHRMILTRK